MPDTDPSAPLGEHYPCLPASHRRLLRLQSCCSCGTGWLLCSPLVLLFVLNRFAFSWGTERFPAPGSLALRREPPLVLQGTPAADQSPGV